jgi:hypothetical protein
MGLVFAEVRKIISEQLGERKQKYELLNGRQLNVCQSVYL